MSLMKKLLAGTLVLALLGVSGAGATKYIRKSREKEVLVVPVESLASDYYTQNTVIQGNVTTNVSQNIRVDQDMIVDQLYVTEGQAVREGELLVTFDMTLVEMELNIARLKHQLLERNLSKAVTRLNSLKNGGPITESDSGSSAIGADSLAPTDMYENLGALPVLRNGSLFATVVHGGLLAAAEQIYDYENITAQELDDDFFSDGEYPGGSGPIDDPVNDPIDDPMNDPIDDPMNDPVDDPTIYPDEGSADDSDFAPDYHFYERLDDESIPLTGSGTEEDPFVFLCNSEPGAVVATGRFLNWMAGYDAEGTERVQENGFWYQLEFYEGGVLTDYANRTRYSLGYFLVNGGDLTEAVPEDAEMTYLVDEATQFEFPVIDPGYMGGNNGNSSLSRAEAIKNQESIIKGLTISLKESDLNIAKLERKVANKEIYSKLDGIVSSMNSDGGSYGGGPFLSIKSKDGFYIKGTISELQLDEIKEGTLLNCSSYNSGNFQATVISVADYPMASDGYGFYMGDSNPNVSNYEFSARIEDQSLKMFDGDWLQITVQEKQDNSNKIVLSRAFVRSENGQNYVYKDDNGVLKKQYVQVGESVDFGYSVVIKAGISRADSIAFPYGKAVVEGAKTRTGSVDELYQM